MLGLYDGKFNMPYLLDQFICFKGVVAFGKIRTDAFPDIFCFSNVQQILLGTIVFIDARCIGQCFLDCSKIKLFHTQLPMAQLYLSVRLFSSFPSL